MTFVGHLKTNLDELSLPSEARRARRERLTYLSPEKLRRLDRSVREAVRATASGDVLEFGIALGGSGVLLAKQARAHGRRFAGFDVFGMIPPPLSEKDDTHSKKRYEVIASGHSVGIGGDDYYGYRQNLFEQVCRTFTRFGAPVDGEGIRLVKGLFEETWPTYATQSVAFAHIDCDWYDPVRYCLKAVEAKLPAGGIVVVDDYNDYGGCRTATDEFLSEHKDFELELGANAILRRRAAGH